MDDELRLSERRSPFFDVLILTVVILAVAAFSTVLDLGDWAIDAIRRLEHIELDEAILTLLALSIGLTWYSWRRARQNRFLLDELHDKATQIAQARQDLERRVEERTPRSEHQQHPS